MAFAEAMERTMRKHDNAKGDSWKSMPHESLQELMLKEVEETKSEDAAIGEWVDVANLCMMVYSNTLPSPEQNNPARKEKPFVYDLPVVKTQNFRVNMPGIIGRFFVTRKEVIRQQHNMICTDGMKEGEVERRVSYEVTHEIHQLIQQEVIRAVEDSLAESEEDDE